MNLSNLNLPSFAIEILMQIYLAEQLGDPIKKSQGWCTVRGNSIDAIREILISQNLIEQKEEHFVVTSVGKQIILSVIQHILVGDDGLLVCW